MLPVTPRGKRATGRIRTDDPVITSDVLYQLSYGGLYGAEGDRTPDLSVANAALSQLSYGPSYQRLMGATGFEPVTSTMST